LTGKADSDEEGDVEDMEADDSDSEARDGRDDLAIAEDYDFEDMQ